MLSDRPCGVIDLFDLRCHILSHRNMWGDRPGGVIALFDSRYHLLSQRNLWSDRPCGVIALFDLRYQIKCVTFFLEQPHGMKSGPLAK